jgi:sulfopyruvate decarboxylase subunit alpha
MLRASLIIEQLRACGITHVVALPDNTSKALLEALATEKSVRVVNLTREGEAWAVAAGLWLGGAVPLVLMQNTGFLESGDALRGTAMRMRVPVLCLLTYRGFSSLQAVPDSERHAPNSELLSRNGVDSCAVVFEPTLRAWGLPYDFVHEDGDVAKIRSSFAQAQKREQPVALLLTQDTA